MGVEGSHGGIGEFGQLGDAGFRDHGWAAGAISGNGTVASTQISTMKITQARGAVAGAGAANSDEAEALNRTSDEFAIEAATDEDRDAMVAEAPGTGEKTLMPEGIDSRRRGVVAGDGVGIADIAVAKGNAKAANGHARDARDDRECKALLQRVGRGHKSSLPARQAREFSNSKVRSFRQFYADRVFLIRTSGEL